MMTGNGEIKKVQLPDGIEFDPRTVEAPLVYVEKRVTEVLDATHGKVHVTFPNERKPLKLAQLARQGYVLLRWTDLTAKQQRELYPSVLPFKSDDLCRVGDLLIMIASESAFRARRTRESINRQNSESFRQDVTEKSAVTPKPVDPAGSGPGAPHQGAAKRIAG